MKQPCEVCGIRNSIGVASSVLGAMSLAYCDYCSFYYAEPLWFLEITLEMNGGWEHTAEWVGETITFIGQYAYAKDVING